MKWFIIGVAALLFIVSTIIRFSDRLEADKTLAMVFMVVAGLVFGANLIGLLKK